MASTCISGQRLRSQWRRRDGSWRWTMAPGCIHPPGKCISFLCNIQWPPNSNLGSCAPPRRNSAGCDVRLLLSDRSSDKGAVIYPLAVDLPSANRSSPNSWRGTSYCPYQMDPYIWNRQRMNNCGTLWPFLIEWQLEIRSIREIIQTYLISSNAFLDDGKTKRSKMEKPNSGRNKLERPEIGISGEWRQIRWCFGANFCFKFLPSPHWETF